MKKQDVLDKELISSLQEAQRILTSAHKYLYAHYGPYRDMPTAKRNALEMLRKRRLDVVDHIAGVTRRLPKTTLLERFRALRHKFRGATSGAPAYPVAFAARGFGERDVFYRYWVLASQHRRALQSKALDTLALYEAARREHKTRVVTHERMSLYEKATYKKFLDAVPCWLFPGGTERIIVQWEGPWHDASSQLSERANALSWQSKYYIDSRPLPCTRFHVCRLDALGNVFPRSEGE